jgi:hypothetical protein
MAQRRCLATRMIGLQLATFLTLPDIAAKRHLSPFVSGCEAFGWCPGWLVHLDHGLCRLRQI